MKNIKNIFWLMGVLVNLNSYCQVDTIIRSGYINLATLVIDYETYNFEGGDISYYSCPGCPSDSIPFTIEYEPPGDFGGITFKLPSQPDTVFNATIIWSGIGQIYYPTTFSVQHPFIDTSVTVNIPNDLRYIDSDGNAITNTVLLSKADSAWDAVNDLNITNLFAASGFKAASYLYTPAVGVFDASVAKWIVFLYHNGEPNSAYIRGEEDTHLKIFPIPFSVQLTFSIADNEQTSISLYDFLGQQVLQQVFTNATTINTEQLADGIYFYELKSSNGTLKTGKVVKH